MAVNLPIYLDNHATTPLDPKALEAMMPYLTNLYGNAASRSHSFGWAAKEGVERAREQVASLINASPKEIIWTSGATESTNTALLGGVRFNAKKRGKHVITCVTEHKATLDSCHQLEKEGYEVTFLEVDGTGVLKPQQVADAIREDTVMVSLMWANNEIGVIHPIAEIGQICRDNNVIFHVDAAQALGKVPVDVKAANIDLMSLSGHKMYGPKGIGALFVRRGRPRLRIDPLIFGGGHERGLRSGTLAVHQIVGMGAAAELAQKDVDEGHIETVRALRDRLWAGIQAKVPEAYLNGSWEHRLPNNLNVSFAYVEGEAMMMAIKELAVSSGSACTSASLEPSYVLRALGVDVELAHTSIRFGLGRFNTEEEVDYAIEAVANAVQKLRDMSPLWEMAQAGIDLKSIQWEAH